jgi:hypothetical protein
LFGSDLKEEDKVTVDRVIQRLTADEEVGKVLTGNNSEDAKMDYFKNKVKDGVIDEYGDRYEFYKMIMNDKIFPQFVDYMYRSVQEVYGRG